MVAPDALVRQVHACFALPRRPHQRAVAFDDGVFQEAVGLLLPDLDPLLVEDVHQGVDVGGVETTKEVACGSGIGNALGAQDIEVDFVVAKPFEILETGAAGQEIAPVVTITVPLAPAATDGFRFAQPILRIRSVV